MTSITTPEPERAPSAESFRGPDSTRPFALAFIMVWQAVLSFVYLLISLPLQFGGSAIESTGQTLQGIFNMGSTITSLGALVGVIGSSSWVLGILGFTAVIGLWTGANWAPRITGWLQVPNMLIGFLALMIALTTQSITLSVSSLLLLGISSYALIYLTRTQTLQSP